MEEKQKLPKEPETQGKGTNTSTTMQVLNLLKSMEKFTAWGLNCECNFNDARKRISTLRKSGYPIRDFRIAGGRKVYFLVHDWQRVMNEAKQRKPDLFDFCYEAE